MLDNKAKFTGIYTQFARRIFAFAYNRLGNRQDSEDILSEVFAAVWANIDNFPGLEDVEGKANTGSCKSLCFTIARNKINDLLRERYRLPAFSDGIEVEDLPEFNQERNPTANNTIRMKLEQLVSELPERDQLFYKLRIQQNYKLSEIATELGINLNNTKVIQNRLTKKLKKLWTTK
jgi:RNA polymerase sigma-70 factor (ECF subfamily)